MKRIVAFVVLAVLCTAAGAVIPEKQSPFPKSCFPDLPGFVTLQCDFHTHTCYSDGRVWPRERVDEAAMEGLDVVAITDHIEYRPNFKYFAPRPDGGIDYNVATEIASSYAADSPVMVVPGAEITRGLPTGHWNCLFLSDVNKIAAADGWKNEFAAARQQGAFTYWNHPGCNLVNNGDALWSDDIDWLWRNGYMMGIEIYNYDEGIYPLAFQWAVEKRLTMIAGTDVHEPIGQLVDFCGGEHRPVTLVFARERTLESLHEALVEGRTAVYADDVLYGFEEYLSPFFECCLTLDKTVWKDNAVELVFTNRCTMPVVVRQEPGLHDVHFRKQLRFRPGETRSITIESCSPSSDPISGRGSVECRLLVENFLVAPGQSLHKILHISRPQ